MWASSGKAPLFTSAISAGETILVVVLGLNSAIAAYYYLRLVKAVMLEDPDPSNAPTTESPFTSRRLAGILSAVGVVILALGGNNLMTAAQKAAAYEPPAMAASTPIPPHAVGGRETIEHPAPAPAKDGDAQPVETIRAQ